MADASREILYKVAYDEAVRALSEQQGAVDSFRTRSGILLSSAAVTTSFLGAQALQGDDLNAASWLALTSFVGVATACLAILWPRGWEGAANPGEVIETYIDSAEPLSMEDLHRDLALHMHHSYLENHGGLSQLALFFQIASGLLTFEVVLWLGAIAVRH